MRTGTAWSGVALRGTWASIQWASVWADQLTGGKVPQAKAYTQFYSALGAIFGCILGAMMGNWFGRRVAYSLLCLGSLTASLIFFLLNDAYWPIILDNVFLAGS